MLDTVMGYCDLCSKAVKDKSEARELMVSGKVFTFCCKSCEFSFLSKDTPEEPSDPLIHQVEETCPLLSWLQEAVRQGASDLFMSVGESPTLKIYGVFKKLSDEVLDHQHGGRIY